LCRGCTCTFNALTGTPLSGLHQRGKWLAHTQALSQGLSIPRVAERLEVAWSTAFRWRHRFLQLPSQRQASALRGIAEADESYFLESSKGQRALLRQARRRAGAAARPASAASPRSRYPCSWSATVRAPRPTSSSRVNGVNCLAATRQRGSHTDLNLNQPASSKSGAVHVEANDKAYTSEHRPAGELR
jgi:hypothetical protein